MRGDEVESRAWVDAGSAPGRSYKCVEKSDLKYPLIHGQGRQVSEHPPPRIPLQLPPAEVGVPLCFVAVAGVLGPAPRTQDVSPSAQGARGPQSTCMIDLCICWSCLLSPHISLVPQARLLGTLAVSRGLGDHQLRVLDTNIQLKPFLLSVPQVRGQQPTPASICPERQTVRLVGAGKGTLRDPQA